MIETSTKIRKTEWTGLTLAQVKSLLRRMGVEGWDIRATIELTEHQPGHMSTMVQRPEDGSRPFFLRVTNQGCGEYDVNLVWEMTFEERAELRGDVVCDADTGVQHGPQFAADPANPTDEELAGAVARGLANGTLIDAAEWMAQQDADEAARLAYEEWKQDEAAQANVAAAAGLDPEASMIVSQGEVVVGTPASKRNEPQPLPGTTDTYSPYDATTVLAAFLGYCTPDHPFAIQQAQELLTTARRVGIAREVNGTTTRRVTVRPAGLGFFRLTYTSLF